MTYFDIVAHRGMPNGGRENTISAFQKAIDLGANGVEMDIRLTKDRAPVIFHYYYLHEKTELDGAIFDLTLEELNRAQAGVVSNGMEIPQLRDVLEAIGGKIELELEIKGPEEEAPAMIGAIVRDYPDLWDSIEFTSYEPRHLLDIQKICPQIPVDLLFPRPEAWMGPDVVAYSAINRAKLAGARGVHLHPDQLSSAVVESIRNAGLEVHAWDVNDQHSLDLAAELQIPKVCTDRLEQALAYRHNQPL